MVRVLSALPYVPAWCLHVVVVAPQMLLGGLLYEWGVVESSEPRVSSRQRRPHARPASEGRYAYHGFKAVQNSTRAIDTTTPRLTAIESHRATCSGKSGQLKDRSSSASIRLPTLGDNFKLNGGQSEVDSPFVDVS